MFKIMTFGLASALMASVLAQGASAAIIAIDTDPSIAGIQTSRTVVNGTPFSVDVVLDTTGDILPTNFDTTIVEVSFNDAGAVLSSGGARAGALAGAFFTLDFFGFVPTAPGLPVNFGPSSPAAGFLNGSGEMGLFNGAPFFTVGPGTVTSMFRLDLTATAVGMSTLLASNQTGGVELALGGLPVPAGLQSASITVQAETALAEPASIALFGLGLAGLGLALRSRRGQAA